MSEIQIKYMIDGLFNFYEQCYNKIYLNKYSAL